VTDQFDRDELRPARESVWALIPRRSLRTAVVLVLMLAAVIALRQRAGMLARSFGEALLGTPSAPTTAPRVRLAPPGTPAPRTP
jgi:hypothetical protein